MKGIGTPLRVRLGCTGLGSVIGLFGMWRFTGGELDASGVWFFLSLLALAFAPYLRFVRTYAGSLFTGVLLICLVVVVQVMVSHAWESGSSTAPIAYLWLPLLGPVVAGVTALAERWLR